MQYTWMPLMGEFLESDDKVVFKGNSREYHTKDGIDSIEGADIGNLLFAKYFSGGKVTADIEFTDISKNPSCELIIYYNKEGNNTRMITVGLLSGPVMFEIREFDGNSWTLHNASGDGKNLRSGKVYRLEVTLAGSKVNLSVDGVNIFTTVLPHTLQQSQVGIWCQSYHDIIIHSYDVSAELPKAFIVMQFKSPYNELYNEVIKCVCKEMGFKAIRVDECFNSSMVISDIVNLIAESKVIIAEITPQNPNVYYEVGYAHALNKPTILLAETTEKLPFDISPFRVLVYENSISGKAQVEEGLRKHLREII